MAQFNENILFLSAFGQPCNKTYSGTAVNEKFVDIAGDTLVVSPWTSATPLSGELLQLSLDALLQNDINLLSAYPDAYFKPTTDESVNMEKFTYQPTGTSKSYSVGDDGWTNSMTVSSTVGTIGGDASGVMLGTTVPAEPFQAGNTWNYGLFGVENGDPKWYPVDVSAMSKDITAQKEYNTVASHLAIKERLDGTATVSIDSTVDSLETLKALLDRTNERMSHTISDDAATYLAETVVPMNWRLGTSAMFVEFLGQRTDGNSELTDSCVYILKFVMEDDKLVGSLYGTKTL